VYKTDSGKTLGRVDLMKDITLHSVLACLNWVPLVKRLRTSSIWWEFNGIVLIEHCSQAR